MTEREPVRRDDPNLVAAVVEDDGDMSRLLRDCLALKGIRSIAVTPGPSLLQDLQSLSFDLLVTDLVMPAVDGLEVIQSVRRHRPDMPILAISGGSAQLPAELGLLLAESMGATTFLYKPFSRGELFDATDRLLEAHGTA